MTSRRDVWCHLEAEMGSTADVVLSVAAAAHLSRVDEELIATRDGRLRELREVVDDHGTCLHLGCDVEPGLLVVNYRTAVADAPGGPPVDDVDLIRYGRPSRYCESDRLHALA